MRYRFALLFALLLIPLLCQGQTYADYYPYTLVCPVGYEPNGVTKSESIPGGIIFRGTGEDEWLASYTDVKGVFHARDYWKDKWNFAQCNCTSYAAFVMNVYFPSFTDEYSFNNGYRGVHWGNGGNWDDAARIIGISVDRDPIPGDIAYWNTLGGYGHVAVVEKVRFDTNGNKIGVDWTQYNNPDKYEWSAQTNRPVTEPDGYIHILAYEEGVSSLHYMDCYEVRCEGQTPDEWERILQSVARYRCRNCNGQHQAIADAFYNGPVFGGGSNPPPPPTPLPNLQVEEITVHTYPEGDDTRLTEERSVMNLGQTYQINVWPVSHSADCQNGNMTGNPDLEVKTDTFFKIALSEDEGTWQLLKRSETHCKYLAHGDSKKEVIPVTIPPDAAGKRLYLKSETDATGDVAETDEGDNRSGIEWYPVNGSCDLVIASGNLTKGRITLNQGEPYGFGGTLLNLGPDSCPSDTRLSYFYMKPGDTSWRYADGDDTPAFKLLPNQTNEEWMTADTLVADIPGTYQGRICADTNNANRETSESNNCFEFHYEVIAVVWKPDFVVSSLWIAEGTTIKSGTRVHPHCVVKNIGNTKPTEDMRLAYYINSNQYRDDDNVEANEMCVGCEQHEQVNNDNIKLGDRGTRSFMCCVDYQGSVAELNEGNNCATIYFTVVK